MLILPMLLGAFQPWKKNRQTLLRNTRMGLITVHEIEISNAYRSKSYSSGFGGRKAPSSLGKISTARVLLTPRHQALCHAINL